jgi:hypothetical protein
MTEQLTPIEYIEERILSIRGVKVIMDSDLARLYGVSTKRLKEQVKRNIGRFPDDFMFCLSLEEGKAVEALRSQIATLKRGQHLKYAPYVFTEHGAVMAANVLNSPLAVRISVQVVRAFIRLREVSATHKDLALKLEQVEQKYDQQFKEVFDAIRALMKPSFSISRRRIGFIPSNDKE